MSEILTYSEIKQKFDQEWVLLQNPKTTEDLSIKEGKILWHSKNRDEVYRKAQALKPKHSAILYLGNIPQDVAVVL